MRLLRPSCAPRGAPRRRGAALMLSVLVLFVLLLIVFQISISTGTNARVARNEETLRIMDETIESVLMQVAEDLKADAESDGGGGAADPAEAALGDVSGGAGGGQSGPTDSRRDDWARPQRTELNELRIRILIQDEDSKLNVNTILTPDEVLAEEAFERLVRTIENARKGTSAEIDPGTARRMATSMLEYMDRRRDRPLPKPELLSDDPDDEDRGLLLSLRELVGLDPELFPEDLFRDYRDERDQVIHSLGSFLTVWTSVSTEDAVSDARQEAGGGGGPPPETSLETSDPSDPGDEDSEDAQTEGDPDLPEDGRGGEGGPGGDEAGQAGDGAGGDSSKRGIAVNLNTAPLAVLDALIDPRDLPRNFWRNVLEVRNEEDESVPENEDPPLDEYGEEILVRKIFTTANDLTQVDGWTGIEPVDQDRILSLVDVKSSVFSIFVTVRRPTGVDGEPPTNADRREIEREEEEGSGLVRTVRCVVWRRDRGDGSYEIVPIVRWEVVDYVPFEVEDYPDEDR